MENEVQYRLHLLSREITSPSCRKNTDIYARHRPRPPMLRTFRDMKGGPCWEVLMPAMALNSTAVG